MQPGGAGGVRSDLCCARRRRRHARSGAATVGERAQSGDGARLRNCRPDREQGIVSDRLPAPLRAYRLFAVAMTPLTPLLLARRQRRGKEHSLRLSERRGVSAMARPPGPLVWLHGASLGELILSLIHISEPTRQAEIS